MNTDLQEKARIDQWVYATILLTILQSTLFLLSNSDPGLLLFTYGCSDQLCLPY
jgi:hypothetical protein